MGTRDPRESDRYPTDTTNRTRWCTTESRNSKRSKSMWREIQDPVCNIKSERIIYLPLSLDIGRIATLPVASFTTT